MDMVYDGILFNGDGPDIVYEGIAKGVKLIKGVEGFTCEIGVRRGLGSITIMKTAQDNSDKRIHIGIDPWGNIPYMENGSIRRSDYTNRMKQSTLRNLYSWCDTNKQDFLMFIMEDEEFFKRFSDGVPVYDENIFNINKFAYIHIDGPHNTNSVKKTVEFFETKTPKGGIWQFDNTDFYDHDKIDEYVIGIGFQNITDKVMEENPSHKLTYQRV